MASPVDFQKEFLSCTICYEIYSTPKSLPCLHTFCQRCLSSYIVAEDDNFGVKRKKAFPCPLCRAFTTPPIPSKPLELWAADFKTNFFIENLKTALNVGGDNAEHSTQSSKELSSGMSPNSLDNTSKASEIPSQSYEYHSWESNNDMTSPWFTPTESISPTRDFFNPNPNRNSSDNVLIQSLPVLPSGKSYEQIKSISAAMPGDYCDSKLYGVCVVDEVIVTLDFGNNSVKTFFNWRAILDVNIIARKLDLPNKPRSLTRISDSEVAVTVPSLRAIYFVQVKPFLKICSIAHTAKRYRCIANSGSDSLIAVTSATSSGKVSSVDIVNYVGIVLRSVAISADLRGYSFDHIDVSDAGLLHLINSDDNVVNCVTQDGAELFRYGQHKVEDGFERLNGLCCRFGDLYLTDFEGNAVYEIKSDCSLPGSREKILSSQHGIKKPTDVHIEPDGTIFVACWDGVVRIYSVKKKPSILMRKFEETAV